MKQPESLIINTPFFLLMPGWASPSDLKNVSELHNDQSLRAQTAPVRFLLVCISEHQIDEYNKSKSTKS